MAKELPDFEEMLVIAHDVGKLTTKIAIDKALLKYARAEITRDVMTKPDCWPSKKPPAFNYIQATFHNIGYDFETGTNLQNLIKSIANSEGELERLKMTFQVNREMINVWKTRQFNKKMTEY